MTGASGLPGEMESRGGLAWLGNLRRLVVRWERYSRCMSLFFSSPAS